MVGLFPSLDMTLAEKQQEWIEHYRIIEDGRERLALMVEEARAKAPLEEALRTEAHRLPGCVSAVWLVSSLENGRCHFRVAADSVMVYGLVSLLSRLFSGQTPAEVVHTPLELLDGLGLARQISPTRLKGLHHVHQAMVDFAQAQLVEEARHD